MNFNKIGATMLNNESIESITSYIENNYLTVEQLADQSNLTVDQLEILINGGCVPRHSHTITKQITFRTDIFGDSVFTEQSKFYYHPSFIKWAIKASQYVDTNDIVDVASKMKSDFTRELYQALMEIEDAKNIFYFCFDENGNVLAHGVEKIMTEHWQYVMDGTYGVCLKEVTAKNMILKNIAVSILEEWVKNSDYDQAHLYARAQKAAELYDSIAAHFAPHEMIKSTRGRLYNKFKNFSDAKLLCDSINVEQ